MVLRSWLPLTSRLRQWNGLGYSLVLVTKDSMAERSWSLLTKLAPRNALRGQESKPDFHLIEPTGRSRGEVELNPALVLVQPVRISLVRRVVVKNHMDLF